MIAAELKARFLMLRKISKKQVKRGRNVLSERQWETFQVVGS